MRQSVLDVDALVGVEGEELVQQVDQLRGGGPREQLVPRHLGALGQRPQEVPRLRISIHLNSLRPINLGFCVFGFKSCMHPIRLF